MAITRLAAGSAIIGLATMAAAAAGDAPLPPPQRVDEPAPRPEPPKIVVSPSGESSDAADVKAPPADKPAVPAEAKSAVPTTSELADSLRAETLARLKQMDDAAAKDAAAAGKKLRPVLEDRLRLLDDWQKAAKELHELEHPKEDPERQAADSRAEIRRLEPLLDQSARDLDSLLPAPFRGGANGRISDSGLSAMKDAIEAARNELKETVARLEKLRAESASIPTNQLAMLTAERDKLHKRVAGLRSQQQDFEAALADAQTPEAGELARERLLNFEWEKRLVSARLQAQEARIGLHPRRMELMQLNRKAIELQSLLSKRILDRMQGRYQGLSEAQERDLKRRAEAEQARASMAENPLERYRARRTAEMLELHAQVLLEEKTLTTNPSPSREEQKILADAARESLEKVKRMIEDGQVSRLDALRLNNDFRRIAPEKERITKNELAIVASRLSYYEGALSNAEADLIHVARDDRFERDSLREHLEQAPPREILEKFDEIEKTHRELLERRRQVLEVLAERAEQTQAEILRRLRTLDEEYGFIRTHIFWVRDQEPVGAAITEQARREVLLVARSLVRLTYEAFDPKLWGHVSAEFVAACIGLVGLPWPLMRLRGAARRYSG